MGWWNRNNAPKLETPSLARTKKRWVWSKRRIEAKPADRFIDHGVCSSCGYTLDGLPGWDDPDAQCPECGVPMVRARLGADLPGVSDEGLRRLGRGLRTLILAGATMLVLPALVMAVFALITSIVDFSSDDTKAEAIFERVMIALMLAGPVLGLAFWCLGWTRVSRAFADRRISGSSPTARGLTRWMTWTGTALIPPGILLASISPAMVSAGTLVIVGGVLGLGGGAMAGLWMLRTVAKRGGSRRLRAAAIQLLLATPVVLAGFGITGYTVLFGGNVTWHGVLTCGLVIWLIGFIVFITRLEYLIAWAIDIKPTPSPSPHPVSEGHPKRS